MSEAVQMFEDNSQALIASRDAAAVARATQEIQAALVIGARNPRDEIKAKARILQACSRKELAEVAEYEYNRGGTRITGPTIDLLRAIASRWGNIRSGWAEVDRRDGISQVRAFAWDVQSNTQAERTFMVKHRRDTREGGYELTDERDIYELLANSAARRVRACLEEVIDSDVVIAAVDKCRETLKVGETTSLEDQAVKLLNVFVGEFGVTKEMIEARLGNSLSAISHNQIASLRRVYKSLKDGVGKREDYFKPELAPKFEGESPKQPGGQTAPTAAVTVPPTSQPVAGSAPSASPTGWVEKPQVSGTHPMPHTNGDRYLRAVRQLCKAGNIAEGVLLGMLTSIGKTDGSAAVLDEVPGSVLQWVHDNWTDVAERAIAL